MSDSAALTIDLTIRQDRTKIMQYEMGALHDGLYYAAFHLTADQRSKLIERLQKQQTEAETRFR